MTWKTIFPRLALMLMLAVSLSSCAAMKTTGRVIATPVTGVRDVVDAPLVSVTNVFSFWADRANPVPQPGAGGGWSWKGGFNFGVGVDFSYYVFWAVSGLFGGVDYVICRSIWPHFPTGISPWKEREEPWGNLYFPNTRALWGKDLDAWKNKETNVPKNKAPTEQPAPQTPTNGPNYDGVPVSTPGVPG